MAKQPVGTPFEGATIITACEQNKTLKSTHYENNTLVNATSVNVSPVGTAFQKTAITTRQETKASYKVLDKA